MAVVYLEHEFFGDERFREAAEALDEDQFITEMRVIRCWRECYNNLTPFLSPREIKTQTRWRGQDVFRLIDALVEVGIADRCEDGLIEFRGVADRIAQIGDASAAGRAGGIASGKARRAKAAAQRREPPPPTSNAASNGSNGGSNDANPPSNETNDLLERARSAKHRPTDRPTDRPTELSPQSPPKGGRPADERAERQAPDPPRVSKRDAERVLADEADRIVLAMTSFAKNLPKGPWDVQRREAERGIGDVGCGIVEARFGKGFEGWQGFIETVCDADPNAQTALVSQLRKSVAAELRRRRDADPETKARDIVAAINVEATDAAY